MTFTSYPFQSSWRAGECRYVWREMLLIHGLPTLGGLSSLDAQSDEVKASNKVNPAEQDNWNPSFARWTKA